MVSFSNKLSPSFIVLGQKIFPPEAFVIYLRP
jgi:hypothetical protein